MDELKFKSSAVLLFFLLLGVSYWAFQQVNPKFLYTSDDVVEKNQPQYQGTQEKIEKNNKNPLESEPENLSLGFSKGSEEETKSKIISAEKDSHRENSTLDDERKRLLDKLEGLVQDKIYMKKGSRGTRVGTVQKFLNLYFDEQSKVDNDYGPKTLERVREFQKREGLDTDGLAGPQTYEKMIDLLRSDQV